MSSLNGSEGRSRSPQAKSATPLVPRLRGRAGAHTDGGASAPTPRAPSVVAATEVATPAKGVTEEVFYARQTTSLLASTHVVANAPLARCAYVKGVRTAAQTLAEASGGDVPVLEVVLLALAKGVVVTQTLAETLAADPRMCSPRVTLCLPAWVDALASDSVASLNAHSSRSHAARAHRLQINKLCSHGEQRDDVGVHMCRQWIDWLARCDVPKIDAQLKSIVTSGADLLSALRGLRSRPTEQGPGKQAPGAKGNYTFAWAARTVDSYYGRLQPIREGDSRYAKGMSPKNSNALRDLGCHTPRAAADCIAEGLIEVGSHALAELWKNSASPQDLEVLACEVTRCGPTLGQKQWLLRCMRTYPEIASGEWRRQMTSAQWLLAVFGEQVTRWEGHVVAPRESEESGCFYNSVVSLRALAVWVLAKATPMDTPGQASDGLIVSGHRRRVVRHGREVPGHL